MSSSERRSLKLRPEDWRALEELAVEFEAAATTGTTTGLPSWRALIRAIANGDLVVSRKADG